MESAVVNAFAERARELQFLRVDDLHRRLYAQDASMYAVQPSAVAFPRNTQEVQALMRLCQATRQPLLPRAAGTSLAGQTVTSGVVVDLGRHMNEILELNVDDRWVRVQPGVILDDLNRYLAPHGLFFGPDTSTASRCMIGGMVGNNSCGSHSILYGNTMQHVLELEVVLTDGEAARLGPWSHEDLQQRMGRDDVLGAGLRELNRIVVGYAEEIESAYPDPQIIRRNSGYPLDDVARRAPYVDGGEPFSVARFLCGTEGTLAVTTEIKLNLVDRPKHQLVVCAHFRDLQEALRATVIAVEHDPSAVELIDDRILEQTKANLAQRENRFFLQDDPQAVLVIEFYRDTEAELEQAAQRVIDALSDASAGYAYPIVRPPDDARVWALRKAGLGLLMGVPGDTKAVSVIEDTAVKVADLPAYVAEIQDLMARHDTISVYHAHASVGELHIRPELDIKRVDEVAKMADIAEEVARIVRRYNGSLSGEHGDGRVRSPYLREFYGDVVYDLHRRIKRAFDPHGLLNPGNIVDPEPIDHALRFAPGTPVPEVDTQFDWSSDLGLVRATEKCNGAGACRKRVEAGGTMCPSYMVTGEEKDTTRGRANVFRQLLMEEPDTAMSSHVLYETMDLCLSCKGCKRECPANVDLARLKAEFQQQYWDAHGTPISALLFGYYATLSKLAAIAPALANFFMTFALTKPLFAWLVDLAPQRQMPPFAPVPFSKIPRSSSGEARRSTVWLYVDPFTEYTEPEVAQAAVEVLQACGYAVEIFPLDDDGRTLLSKGLVRAARKKVRRRLDDLAPILKSHPDRVVVGLEPSALLTLADEWPDLAAPEQTNTANDLAGRVSLLDDFLARESPKMQWTGRGEVLLHGHCHQKALVGTAGTEKILRAAGYDVTTLPTGCCGMAGSFGYERKHYAISQAVGELVLFPALRDADADAIVCAPGTSCRHQIADGVGRTARHPALLLRDALDEAASREEE